MASKNFRVSAQMNNNVPPPAYTVDPNRAVHAPPSLPTRSPQNLQPTAAGQNQQPKAESISTGKLVGELATRAIGGAFSAVKTGVAFAGEAVSKASSNNSPPPPQNYGPSGGQNYGQRMSYQPGPIVPTPAPTSYPQNSNPQYYQQPIPQQSMSSQYPAYQQFNAPSNTAASQLRPYPAPQQYTNQVQKTGPDDFWAPMVDRQAWNAVFYFLLLDFPFALFAFVWCLVTMLVGCALLVVFPIGYPLLYLCTLSWRSLAHIHVLMLVSSANGPHMFKKPVFIDATGPFARQTFPFSRHISDWYSWKCGLYFIFKNFLYSLYTFIYSILIIALFIPMMCLAPLWLMNIKRIYLSKQRGAIESLG